MIIGWIAPWEIALAAALLLGAVALVQSFGARHYSAGVLLHGQRIGLRSVWRATRVHR